MPHTSYDILGPFSIGKMEYDGDPLESPVHGGVEKARIGAKRFPSEFAEGGFVSWQAHKTGAYNGYAVDVSFPHILWNKHVQLTNSMPIHSTISGEVAQLKILALSFPLRQATTRQLLAYAASYAASYYSSATSVCGKLCGKLLLVSY